MLKGHASPWVKQLVFKEGAHIVTSDGVPMFVVLSEEEYQSLQPVDGSKPAGWVRVKGKLFREVV